MHMSGKLLTYVVVSALLLLSLLSDRVCYSNCAPGAIAVINESLLRHRSFMQWC